MNAHIHVESLQRQTCETKTYLYARVTAYYELVRPTTTYYYDLLLPTTSYDHLLLDTTTYYYYLLLPVLTCTRLQEHMQGHVNLERYFSYF